ncbi:P-loop containing nucleoside triphosphate hydrolase protein [Syncephalis fuscata]|nr:P-loop containing nucleoside triphosphate hydrolase protein [Syncephalis fuscata]
MATNDKSPVCTATDREDGTLLDSTSSNVAKCRSKSRTPLASSQTMNANVKLEPGQETSPSSQYHKPKQTGKRPRKSVITTTATPSIPIATSSQYSNTIFEKEEGEEEYTQQPTNKHRRTSEQHNNNNDTLGLNGPIDMSMVSSPMTNNTQNSMRSVAAEMGVIESVDIIDFMCHRRLTMRFGPHVNFVVGNNGSGKSAILTAIIICLGAKANVTQRASNLKSLIREGANFAEIIIRLRNRGADAFRQSEFGSEILVERRIIRDASSQYRLRNGETRAVISTKREDLIAMCDHMGIQVDNPMNILSQDTAKAFLSSSKPEDKYEFFARGTQLTQLSEEYALIRESLENTERLLGPKRQALPDMRRGLREAELRLHDMQQARELEKRLDGLKNEMAWAQVDELEKELKKIDKRVAKAEQRAPILDENIATENAQKADIQTKVTDLIAQVNAHETSMQPVREKAEGISNNIREIKHRLMDLTNEERDMNSTIVRLRAAFNEHQKTIEEETNKLRQNSQSNNDRINDDIVKIQESITELRQEEIQCEQMSRHNRDVQQENEEVEKLQRYITTMREQQTDRIKAFGRTVPQVLAAIKRDKGWHQVPIGPLGNYVKLIESKWADTLESLLGNTLGDFIVTNHADKERLMHILRAHQCGKSRVYVTPDDPTHDHSRGEPDSRFLTVLRVLNISHPMVTRQLVIQNRIEQIVLIEERIEAERVMSNGFPSNVTACYTREGFSIGTRSGGSATIAMSQYTGPPRFTVDIQQKLRQCEAQKEVHRGKLQEIEVDTQQLRQQQREINEQIRTNQKTTNEGRRTIQQLRRQLEELQDKLQEIEPANLAVIEEEKQRTQREIDMTKQQYAQLSTERHRVISEETELKQQLAQIREELTTGKEKTSQINESIDELRTEQLKCDARIQHWMRKQRDELERIAAVHDEREQHQAKVEAARQQAASYCPERVEVTKPPGELDREIHQIQLRLEEAERTIGATLDQVISEVNQKQDAYRRAKKDLERIGQEVELLNHALATRLKRLEAYKHLVARRARHNFLWNLSQRGYAGKLEFDHEKRRLTPRVQTDEHVQDRTAEKDPRSLSGGEKSFSTICLLLALWESMGCPIRGLDEYDVFMDAVNRSISTRMIIDSARLAQRTQFILITPQSMDNIQLGPDVRVLKLQDPERNQGVLPFN